MTRLKGTQQNRAILVIGTLVAVILIAAVVLFSSKSASGSSGKSFDLNGQPLLGQASAPVTMVVFEDFKCPNCKNFEDNTMPTIQSKYIDTGKVKMYKLNFPFIGPDSTTAAEAAECAYVQKGDAGYNSFATLLFRAQGEETTQWATKDKMYELAGYVDGLDAAKFKTCLDSEATKAQVDADKAQANKAGVNATPSVFINGTLASDYSAGTVSAAIDQASK
ncbi:DsbA family protein [Deinococcus sp. KNUC1210]|uniref:DsbA family protein n=1 Tax=Deinococcus sp. KNUC1210 TaxID=2917691 RepID=UPI001EF0B9EA|nr:DsbA family protein [Deinococcus sp. KNUC1210]ULH15924.1 DsbA family protein [Deinococcus sp. KNUC1210]